MVIWTRIIKPIILFTFAYFIYTMMMDNKNLEYAHFVPSNVFETPKNLNDKDFKQVADKFGTLIQIVNGTAFNVSYQLDNILNAFITILNNAGVGKFIVVSVGENQQFTLLNVLIQDVNTLAITRFKRVDFIVESLNPFKIHKVIITPDQQFISSQNVVPTDKLKQELFRIQNPLHLFYPYRTSDNEMIITSDDNKLFTKELQDKAVILKTISEGRDNTTSTNIDLSNDIVGTGPLHPIGF